MKLLFLLCFKKLQSQNVMKIEFASVELKTKGSNFNWRLQQFLEFLKFLPEFLSESLLFVV
jgi:hypothetical protein